MGFNLLPLPPPLPLVQSVTMGRFGTRALETGEVFSVTDPGAPVLYLAEARLIRNAVTGNLRAFETQTPRVPRVPRARRWRATYP